MLFTTTPFYLGPDDAHLSQYIYGTTFGTATIPLKEFVLEDRVDDSVA